VSAPAAPEASPAWRRFLLIGAVLLVLVAGVVLLFWDTLEGRHAINGLSSHSQATQREMYDKLRTSTDPKTDDLLLDAVADGGRNFDVRTKCVDLLLARNRLTAIEGLARSGDLLTRGVILVRLARESFFKNEVVPDPTFQVEATVRGWLADTRIERRSDAIRLALHLELPDVMGLIRPLLTRAVAEGAGQEDTYLALVAAAEAVARYKDCESAEAVARLAEGDPDLRVRLGTLDVLERLVAGLLGDPPLCPGALPDERMLAIVRGTLDAPGAPDFVRNMRIKGLGMIERHPAWLPTLAARVRAILDGPGNGAERRAALAALVMGKDSAIGPDVPRYMHDRDFEVRSTATQKADQVPGLAAAALWIGILRDESDGRAQETMRQAHTRLKLLAGSFLGLPEGVAKRVARPTEEERALQEFLQEQLRTGQSSGVTREAWTDEWFKWFAGQQKLEGEALERAMAARKAFRAAMDRNDVAAARAALEGAPQGDGGVFLYEQGWLAARAANP
jgi:hypothetical protein